MINISSLTENLVGEEGTDTGRYGVSRSPSEEAPLLDHHEVWLPGSTVNGSNTNESLRCRQKKLYEHTRTVQAALPDLFLEIADERVETDDGGQPKEIVSYEKAAKQINEGQIITRMVPEIISQWREKAANKGRIESDGDDEIDERHGMISLQELKKAVTEGK